MENSTDTEIDGGGFDAKIVDREQLIEVFEYYDKYIKTINNV